MYRTKESTQYNSRKPKQLFERPDEMMSVYTASRILLKVRERFGSAAMETYLKSYVSHIDESNPNLREAVGHAIGAMNTERMYLDMIRETNE